MNETSQQIQELKEEIAALKARNARVEADKAWETSWVRIVCIAVCTYVVIVLFFLVADLPKPFLNPIVPMVGYVLSTLGLGMVRRGWRRFKI